MKMWDSNSDSEDYDDEERMFDPDYDVPCGDEDVYFDMMGAMEFWDSKKNGTIVREVFAHSLKSLETMNAEKKKNGCHTDGEWDIIRIVTDKKEKTLSIIDNGVGMTKDELECYGSPLGGGRGLLSVAEKVVVTTKREDDGDEFEYVLELSPGEDKKISVATKKDEELLFRGTRRGTKITLLLKQDEEVEHYLFEYPTYRVLADSFSSTIYYRVYILSKEGDIVNVTGFVANINGYMEGSYHINNPVNFYDPCA